MADSQLKCPHSPSPRIPWKVRNADSRGGAVGLNEHPRRSGCYCDFPHCRFGMGQPADGVGSALVVHVSRRRLQRSFFYRRPTACSAAGETLSPKMCESNYPLIMEPNEIGLISRRKFNTIHIDFILTTQISSNIILITAGSKRMRKTLISATGAAILLTGFPHCLREQT